MFLAVAEVVFEVVTLIFEGVERLVFNFPAGTAGLDQLNDVMFTDLLVGYPTVVISGFLIHFEPVLKKIDLVGVSINIVRI